MHDIALLTLFIKFTDTEGKDIKAFVKQHQEKIQLYND